MFFYNFFLSILTLAYVKRRLSLHFGVMGFLKGMDFLIFLSFGFDALTFWSRTGKLLFLDLKMSFPTHMACSLSHLYCSKERKKGLYEAI